MHIKINVSLQRIDLNTIQTRFKRDSNEIQTRQHEHFYVQTVGDELEYDAMYNRMT